MTTINPLELHEDAMNYYELSIESNCLKVKKAFSIKNDVLYFSTYIKRGKVDFCYSDLRHMDFAMPLNEITLIASHVQFLPNKKAQICYRAIIKTKKTQALTRTLRLLPDFITNSLVNHLVKNKKMTGMKKIKWREMATVMPEYDFSDCEYQEKESA